MGQNKKPNFRSYSPKKSGGQKGTQNSKRLTTKTHHDSLKGNRGNGGGKKR